MDQSHMSEAVPGIIDTGVDAREAREAESKGLGAILDQYPLPPEFRDLTEERAAAIADEAVAECRASRRQGAK